ncbi:MAG TPA: hemerythrin domain-containing protein [Rubrivivax sp.]|nr:hemerythrin domain-containing protein [Burkholderiales bacterium]HNU12340.1 hemerythrin domain-containing protein [Rubrivivax sp.]
MTRLAQALQKEHEEIDAALAACRAALSGGGAPASAAPMALRALQALRRHIYLEETMLFPPMRKGRAFAAIFVMLREHGQMWPLLDELDALLEQGAPAPRTAEVLTELEQVLAPHNDKEEKIVYSLADAAHAGESGEQMLAFLASGRMPAGWVCDRAGGGAPKPAA